MSSLDLRRAPIGLALLVAFAALGGCIEEIRPLYGSGSFLANGVQAEKMQSVAVDEISGRLGHYLGDDLKLNLNGTGAPTEPRYHLVITLDEGIETPLIDTVEGLATSATIVTTAHFRLMPVANEKVFVGKAYVAASYDRNTNRFTNVRAARDAEIRDARRLADEITTQVAAELATQH
jgi:LPS-assembly lipoprotein